MSVGPIELPANQPTERFYDGGARIVEFRGVGTPVPNTPEDWVASTTTVRGEAESGLTRLPDGRLLVEAIAADPTGWLGAAHCARFGVDTMLLVKLLDAGQRLPVHAHPDGAFAAEHLGAAHGKAEAWYILTPGIVHLGLARDLSRAELDELVAAQDSSRMLALMHSIDVAPGDAVFVPAGTLHAIGEGVLLAEVQEPEDLSILLEWIGFALDGERDGHVGLGFETALAAVDRRGLSEAEVAALITRGVRDGAVLPPTSFEYFRLDRVDATARFAPGFAIVIALGAGTLVVEHGERVPLRRGSTIVVPFAAGSLTIEGAALVARPPAD